MTKKALAWFWAYAARGIRVGIFMMWTDERVMKWRQSVYDSYRRWLRETELMLDAPDEAGTEPRDVTDGEIGGWFDAAVEAAKDRRAS